MKLFTYKETNGPGIGKDAPAAPAYIRFFKIYFGNLAKMVGLNLLYVFLCLPIVTIGPATAALNYVMRNYSQGKHVDMLADFLRKCKEYFKQGFLLELFDVIIGGLLFVSITLWMDTNLMAAIPPMIRIIALVALLFIVYLTICANFYMFTMLVSFDLKLKQIVRNSYILAMHKIGRNVVMLLFNGVFFVLLLCFWQILLPVLLAFTFTLTALFNNFMVYPVLLKHVAASVPEPEEPDADERIFKD